MTQLLVDSQSGLLYFTEPTAVRVVRVIPSPVHDDTACLAEDLAKLIDGDDIPAADQVTFLVEGKRIRVSKTSLCIRSTYFKNMFESGFIESTTVGVVEIPIEEATYDAFYALISFLVTGRIDMRRCWPFLLDLLLLSNRYLVNGLRLPCSQHLVANAQQDSKAILGYMAIADRYGFEELLDGCLDVLVPDLESVYCQEEFKGLSSGALQKVISRLMRRNIYSSVS